MQIFTDKSWATFICETYSTYLQMIMKFYFLSQGSEDIGNSCFSIKFSNPTGTPLQTWN